MRMRKYQISVDEKYPAPSLDYLFFDVFLYF